MINHESHELYLFVKACWMKLIADYHKTRFHSDFNNSSTLYHHIVTHFLLLLCKVAYNSHQFYYDSSYASMLIAMLMTMLMTMFLTIVDRSSLDYRVVSKSTLFRISLCSSESYR